LPFESRLIDATGFASLMLTAQIVGMTLSKPGRFMIADVSQGAKSA
jgi:hypothetical protein